MQVRMDIWNQFGGNPAGSSFRFVNSLEARELRWGAELPGPTDNGSPVLGPDGTIYIGTSNGHLVAANPQNGSFNWNITLASPDYAVRPPAVADDGTIYCVCQSNAAVRDHRTPRTVGQPVLVVSVAPSGAVNWQTHVPALPDLLGTVNGVVNGAPRVLSGTHYTGGPGVARIFFSLRYTLIVDRLEAAVVQVPSFVRVLAIVDEHSTFLLMNRYEENTLFVDAHGGGGIDDGSGASLTDPGGTGGLPDDAMPCADTPVVFGAFPAIEPWTIVAPGDFGLYALRWSEQDQALAGTKSFFPYNGVFPGPAAFPNGLLVGTAGGDAVIIDPDTFTQYVPHLTSLGGKIITVAGGPRQMYFVPRFGALFQVDVNGTVVKRQNLPTGSVAVPALSANHVHVMTMDGLHTFSLDLQQEVGFVRLGGMSAGLSSPAIGPNGDIYAASGSFPPGNGENSSLFAFFDGTPRISVAPGRTGRPGTLR